MKSNTDILHWRWLLVKQKASWAMALQTWHGIWQWNLRSVYEWYYENMKSNTDILHWRLLLVKAKASWAMALHRFSLSSLSTFLSYWAYWQENLPGELTRWIHISFLDLSLSSEDESRACCRSGKNFGQFLLGRKKYNSKHFFQCSVLEQYQWHKHFVCF